MAFHTQAHGMVSVPGQTPIKTDTVLFTHLKVGGPENCPNFFGAEESRSQDKRCQAFCFHRKHSFIFLSYGNIAKGRHWFNLLACILSNCTLRYCKSSLEVDYLLWGVGRERLQQAITTKQERAARATGNYGCRTEEPPSRQFEKHWRSTLINNWWLFITFIDVSPSPLTLSLFPQFRVLASSDPCTWKSETRSKRKGNIP